MNAERDALNAVFPQLREKCRQRGLEFITVDLRWGVTEHAARQGRVLDICMREIDNARPFFIGIMGQRYGWVPTPADLGIHYEGIIKQYPWVADAMAKGMSITEMEMQYAVLSDSIAGSPKMDAAFFLRKDAANIPDDFKEKPGSAEEDKLTTLRDKLATHSTFPAQDFTSPEELAEKVKAALDSFIDKEFPLASTESFDMDVQEQDRLLQSRLRSHFSLKRYQADFDKWLTSDAKHLLINGWEGRGKSYLTAEFVRQLRESSGPNAVIYADCSTFKTVDSLTEYVLTEVLHQLGVRTRQRSERSEMLGCLGQVLLFYLKVPFILLKAMFLGAFMGPKAAQASLYKAQTKNVSKMAYASLRELVTTTVKTFKKGVDRKVFVAWDNLDAAPEGMVEMISTLSGATPIRHLISARTNSEVDKNAKAALHPTILQVANLTDAQAREYITNYLASYGKRLDESKQQCQKIVKCNIGGVPSLLSQVMELLVNFGSYEQLDAYIDNLAAVENSQKVFEMSIANLTKIFPGELGGDFAINLLSALTVVPSGLTYQEIQDIFKPTPLVWASVSPYLTSICQIVGGHYRLGYPSLLPAIKAMVPEDKIDDAVSEVAEYFEDKLLMRIEHTHKLGQQDTNKILEDNFTFERQAKVLPQLYYLSSRHLDDVRLFCWMTYPSTWAVLSEAQCNEFWGLLYKKGFTMREYFSPDVFPRQKFTVFVTGITIGSRGKDNGIHGNWLIQKTLTEAQEGRSIISGMQKIVRHDHDLNPEIYTKWLKVAGLQGNQADVAWLQNSVMRVTKSLDTRQEAIMAEARRLKRLLTENKPDEVIASIGKIETGNSPLIFVLYSLYASAYMLKNQPEKGLEYTTKIMQILEVFNVVAVSQYFGYIVQHARLVQKAQNADEARRILPFVAKLYEPTVKKGLNNSEASLISQAYTLLLMASGNNTKAHEIASVWLSSCQLINADTTFAKEVLNATSAPK